jgi:hypothetical protein
MDKKIELIKIRAFIKEMNYKVLELNNYMDTTLDESIDIVHLNTGVEYVDRIMDEILLSMSEYKKIIESDKR